MTESSPAAARLRAAMQHDQEAREERRGMRSAAACVALLAFVTLAIALAGRHWIRLPAEALVLRSPASVGLLTAILLLVVLSLAWPGVRRRPGWVFWPAVLAAIGANLATFRAVDPSPNASSFLPNPDHSFAALGSRPGWTNHFKLLPLYAFLHDHMRGSTIISYRPRAPLYLDYDSVFVPYYLRYMAGIVDCRHEDYDPTITPGQADFLRSLPHRELADPYYTRVDWIVVTDPGPRIDTYRVLTDGERHYLLRQRRVPEVRAR